MTTSRALVVLPPVNNVTPITQGFYWRGIRLEREAKVRAEAMRQQAIADSYRTKRKP